MYHQPAMSDRCIVYAIVPLKPPPGQGPDRRVVIDQPTGCHLAAISYELRDGHLCFRFEFVRIDHAP